MKNYVFRYSLMVQDMAGGGINPDLSSCEKYKVIDGRNTFVDRQSGYYVAMLYMTVAIIQLNIMLLNHGVRW